MKYIEHIKEGLRNLYFAKLRSILALLGVLVGTASVVAMVLGGELATQEALREFKSLGTDLLAVSINSTSDENPNSIGQPQSLSLTEALALKKSDKNIVDVAPYTQLFNPIIYNGNSISAMTLGVTGHFADIIQIKIKKGRFISLFDRYEFFCVIGHDIYQNLKEMSGKEPLGQPIQIGKNLFIIVGVADTWPENSFIYADIDKVILIPLLTSTALSKYSQINNIIMRLTPVANIQHTEDHISSAIRQTFPDKQVSFRSAKELIAKMEKQSDILTVFLGLIGSVSLLVGGVGVMNIMLVSVIERRREIGIRRAVGATRFDIAILFLLEAVMLTFFGGVLGVIMGILIAYIIAVIWHWEFMLFLWPPLVGFSVSFAVGIFSGFYPAYLASKLNPIEALRTE